MSLLGSWCGHVSAKVYVSLHGTDKEMSEGMEKVGGEKDTDMFRLLYVRNVHPPYTPFIFFLSFFPSLSFLIETRSLEAQTRRFYSIYSCRQGC